MIRISLIQSFEQLLSLTSQWNYLAHGVPFRRWEWLVPWWEAHQDAGELYVLAAHDGREELVGLAPWFVHHDGTRGRVLRFLGSGKACSDYQSVLSTVEYEDDVLDAVSKWLMERQHDRDRWDALELDGVAADDPAIRKLVEHFARNGYSVQQRPLENAWRIALPSTWDEYVSRFPKNRRKNLRRWWRKVHQDEAFCLRFATDSVSLARGWEVLVDLHQRRRESLEEPGCFVYTEFRWFLRQAADRFFDAGDLDIAWLEWNEKPIAVDFNITAFDTIYAYQSGIDPDHLDLSPGNLLMVAQLSRVIADGKRYYDLLRGDESYKRRWGAEMRPLTRIRVIPPRLSARVRHGLWTAGCTVRWLFSEFEPAGSVP